MTDTALQLEWLPHDPDWATILSQSRKQEPPEAFPTLMRLANRRIDFIQTARLDRAVQQLADYGRVTLSAAQPVRLALLGSSTLTHLIPGIRVGALRRGLWVDVYEGAYGMYRRELHEPSSPLHAFRPDVLLLALDAHHLGGVADSSVEEILDGLSGCWKLARESLGCTVLQQTALPVFPAILGNNERRYANSPLARIWSINEHLRERADREGVHLLEADHLAACEGVKAWFDEALWHRSKQEVHPRASHIYGEHVGRLLAAIRGRSYKCLVLDLDNTLWGGVIGDDGLSGIALGQGSAVGEAHLAVQRYALELSRRGVILAVCSKNDESVALEAFDRHPEMLLRSKDIACFVANWDDKATNLRQIARRLNIGTDALVFADDNPFERNLVRQEIPEVAVPELPEDPAGYAACIAAAGYFEALGVTNEDRDRTELYRTNAEREALRETVTDLPAYLASLRMELRCSPFDEVGLPRIVQLINKTNQFNLTTRRYTEPEVRAVLADAGALHLQFRLIDRFGDNGIIGLVIGRLQSGGELVLDTWLMSCRVLGRQVESATLNVVARQARSLGARTLIGHYRPTQKNGMVKDHYPKLGFQLLGGGNAGDTSWKLELGEFKEAEVAMTIVEGQQ